MPAVTCHLRYVIDPYKMAWFEEYGRLWMKFVEQYGGTHHGYFMPSEGTNNVAYALFSFPSLAAYEDYRVRAWQDPVCLEVMAREERERSILSYDRTFLRPVMDPAP